MPSESDQKPRGISFKEALEQLDVHALRFIFQFHSTTFKVFWFLLLFGGFCAAGYYIFQIVNEFRSSPTATKVSAVEQNLYDYPPLYFCSRYNLDIEKLQNANLSDPAIAYAISLTQEIDTTASGIPLDFTDDVSAETEFSKLLNTGRFETYGDFYRWLAHNFSRVVDKESDVLDVDNFPIVLSANPTYDGKPTKYRLCYRALTRKYTPNSGESFYMEYEVKRPPTAQLMAGNLENDFMFITENHRVVLEKDQFNLRRNRLTTVRLSAKKYINLNTDGHPCKSREESIKERYSQPYCRYQCYNQAVEKCHNCTMLTEDTPIDIAASSLCSWFNYPDQKITCPDGRQHYQHCAASCLYPCEYFTYEYSVTLSVVNRTNYDDDRVAVWLFYEVDDGVLVYEEIPTYTWASMVSNIGGQLGLWTGASILTLLELIYLFVHVSLENCKARKREQRKNSKNGVSKTPESIPITNTKPAAV